METTVNSSFQAKKYEMVCLSVRTLTSIISGLGKYNGSKNFGENICQKVMPQNRISQQGALWA